PDHVSASTAVGDWFPGSLSRAGGEGDRPALGRRTARRGSATTAEAGASPSRPGRGKGPACPGRGPEATGRGRGSESRLLPGGAAQGPVGALRADLRPTHAGSGKRGTGGRAGPGRGDRGEA